MPTLWVLDKYLKQGVVYQTPKRVAYVIKEIGTNSSGLGHLKIEETEMGDIDADVAPLRMTKDNTLGPLVLEDYYYVIPPETKFAWEGDSGSLCRIKGDIVLLGIGEGVPGELLTRFSEQAKKNIRVYVKTVSLGTDEVWKADEEVEVFAITPLTTEKILFDGFVGVKVTGNTVSEGDFAVVFYMNNKPLELDVASGLGYGIDVKSMPLPPNEVDGMIAFSLKNFPIEVPGDQTLSVRVKNISGADKAPASGSAWSITLKMVGKYERA